MEGWLGYFKIDPLTVLLESDDPALNYFALRDLSGEDMGSVESLWELPEPRKILREQWEDGSWPNKSRTKYDYPALNRELAPTLKNANILVNQYGFDRRHPAIEKTATYFFSCQTAEGDFRGILGTQYMPYYHGLILENLVKAGYAGDPRVTHGMDWLVARRQTDGGWMIPIQERWSENREIFAAPKVPFDPLKPSSHIATGMALPAFALQPDYQHSQTAREAGDLLKARFFQRDPNYTSMGSVDQWTKFKYPFWWPNVLTVLDALMRIGYTYHDEDVNRGLEWFIENQGPEGFWRTGFSEKGNQVRTLRQKGWIALAVCRVFKMAIGYSPRSLQNNIRNLA